MKQIRELIKNHLKTIHPQVYFLKAPKKSVTPYLVYSVEVFDDGEGLQTLALDVDGWDVGDDSTNLEDLMFNLDTSLDKKVLTDGQVSISFYLDRKLPMVDEDPRMNRRLYMYHGRLYKKE